MGLTAQKKTRKEEGNWLEKKSSRGEARSGAELLFLLDFSGPHSTRLFSQTLSSFFLNFAEL